jgi:hypothetical protein
MPEGTWPHDTRGLSIIESRLWAANHKDPQRGFHPVLLAVVLLCPIVTLAAAAAAVIIRVH